MKVTNKAWAAPGAVTGIPKQFLRLEGLALAGAAITLYGWLGGPWWLFAVLILAPDLSLFGFLAGPRAGALVYNIAHTTLGSIVSGIAAIVLSSPKAEYIALIWLAHIGIDRALGYGLKYGSAFADTHLGRIGKDAAKGGATEVTARRA